MRSEYFPISKSDFDGTVLVTGAVGLHRQGPGTLSAPACRLRPDDDKRRPGLLMSAAELGKVRWLTATFPIRMRC